MKKAKITLWRLVSLLLVLCTLLLSATVVFAEEDLTEDLLCISIIGLDQEDFEYSARAISRNAPDMNLRVDKGSFMEGSENWLVVCNQGPGDDMSLGMTPELYCFIDACLGLPTMAESSWAAYLVRLAASGRPVYVFYSDEDTIPARFNRKAAIWLEEFAGMSSSNFITKDCNVYYVDTGKNVGTITLFHLPTQDDALQKAAEELTALLWED